MATGTHAADTVEVGPAPGWVAPAPPIPARTVDGALDVRLVDVQTRFDDSGLHYHFHQIVKILSPEGLIVAGNFAVGWQPAISTARVNQAVVRRGDKTIDVLGDGHAFQVLRREANLENLLQLDGALTALLSIPDLRIGDEVETRWTLDLHNPVLAGQWEHRQQMGPGLAPARLSLRYSWPAGRKTVFRVGAGLPTPKTIEGGGLHGFTIDAENYSAPPLTAGAPGRFAAANAIAVSDFRDWAQVVAVVGPLFDKAAMLGSNSAVADEAAKIAASSTDPMARADAALRLVQGQVRYFARVDGLGGYQPQSADAVWAARSGDCKGKTVLLLALLRRLGIEADAALVSAAGGDGLDKVLPMPSWFNHVIVRARIAGKIYWLDGTRLGDRSVVGATVPDVRWALPLNPGNAALVPVVATVLTAPDEEWRLDLDARAGTTVPAKATASGVFRGDKAMGLRTSVSFMSAADRDKFLRAMWSQRHDWLTIDTVTYAVDDADGAVRMGMTGTGVMDWNTSGATPAYRYEANKARLGQDIAPKRNEGDKTLPVVVAPVFTATHQTILLPDGGKGFSVEGDTIDTVIGGIHYQRSARIADGRFETDGTTSGNGGEVGFAAAQAADQESTTVFGKQLFVRMPRVGRFAAAPSVKPVAKPRRGVASPAVWTAGSISDEDYPAEAIRASAQGISVVSFDIDVQGRVGACRITASSGSAPLDERTCTIVKERFIYEPAHDSKGLAVPETRVQRVKWQLPSGAGLPLLRPSDTSVAFVIEADGKVSSCKVTGAPPGFADPCPTSIWTPPLLDKDGKPYRALVTQRMSRTIEPAPPEAPAK